jgi:hypothetical protein
VTSLVRRVAGGLTVLESVWLLYAYYDAPTTLCLSTACPSQQFIPLCSWAAPALALALLAIGAVGIWGASFSYGAGAVLSTAALTVTAYTVAVVFGHGYAPTVSNDAIIGVAFALVALLVNIDAMRSKSGILEEANPMNLPVFG